METDRAVIPEFTEINFVKFYNAMVKSDASILGVEEDILDELVFRYREIQGIKEDGYDRAAKPTRLEMVITRSCLLLYSRDPENKEILDVIESLGITISKDTEITSQRIADKLKGLNQRYKLIQGEKPQTSGEPMGAYDILANLSSSLEFGLDFKNITVAEYLSYSKVLKAKLAAIKSK